MKKIESKAKRSVIGTLIPMFVVTFMVAIATVGSSAQDIMPSFSGIPTGWVTDRYEPASFSNVGTYQGHADVLGIGINSSTGQFARPAGKQGLFYATQGRQYAFSPNQGPGSALSADLYIPSSWSDAANGNVRTDMWGVMVDSSSTISAYPIIGFTNYGGAPRFRVFDGDIGWVDLVTPVTYGGWTNFSMKLNADSSITFYINGSPVFTDYATGLSTAFSAVIMQAYNFDHTEIADEILAQYTAYWSNAQTALDMGQCKANGWRSLTRSDGTKFKNQGDCIQYVKTGK